MDAYIPLAEEVGSRQLLARLWREHLRRHRGRLILVMVLTALMAGLTALYPVVIDRAFSMFTARDQRILYQVPALVIIITGAKAAVTYFQTVLTQNVVLRVIRELQQRMFAHLTRADLSRVEREAPAQLAARFTTDAAIIREALTRAVGGIANAITVVGLIASMFWLDWRLSLIAAALYPLAAVPIQRIGKKVRRASGGMQERMGETATLLTESFTQARTVRAYRLEETEASRANAAFEQLNRALMRMTRTRSGVDPMLEVLGGAAVAAVMGFAGWRAAVGTNTVGNFTGFVAALLIASQPLRALGSLNAALQEGLAGLIRVFRVIDEPPGIIDRPGTPNLPAGPGRLVFENVGFAYPDGRAGLHDLSFTAEPGLTIALVGPSGAGKSTALALIPRLHDVTSGRITLDGAEIRSVSLDSLRDAIAYVGQDTIRRHGRRQYWLGAPRRAARSDCRRRGRRRRGRLHCRAPGRVRHARRSQRTASVRRPAAADRPGPRAAAGSPNPAVGRGDLRPRCRERGGRAGSAVPAARRAYHHRCRAPPLHRPRRGPGRRDGRWRRRGAGHTRGTDGPGWSVCPAGPHASPGGLSQDMR
jgi:subfamily B ATP-binding cassette protein MsbA